MVTRLAIIAAALGLCGFAQQRPASPTLIAFRNVTVIAATGAPPIANATVLVRDDRIAAVGPAGDVVIPSGAHVIDGAGRYLTPGFIELHAHVSKSRASSLGLFLANGVTTVRDMGGDHEELLRWRREIASGERLGPRMLIAGPYLESASNIERMRRDPPEARIEPFDRIRIGIGSPDEARRVVASLAVLELDFLKIRTVQDRATYLALNQAADAHGLKLVGHVSGIPPQVVLEAGQDGIDHLFHPSLDGMTREQRLAVWRQFAERRVPVVPTVVVVFESILQPTAKLKALTADVEGLVDPRRTYISRFTVLDWREQVAEISGDRQATFRKLWDTTIRRDLREMHEAGMDVLAGSDVAVVNIFPGFSLHDEMALFVSQLGLTPAEALERATSRSARFLGISDSVGTVERGKIADLVLLDANPLVDIRNTRRIAAVVVRGSLFDEERLSAVLDSVESHPDRQKDDWGRTRGR
jgi:imidazolonepropionase-like amidohydrolase